MPNSGVTSTDYAETINTDEHKRKLPLEYSTEIPLIAPQSWNSLVFPHSYVQFLWEQKSQRINMSIPTGWTTKIQFQQDAEILFFLAAPCQTPSPISVLPDRYWGSRRGKHNGQSHEPEISSSKPRPNFGLSVLNTASIFAFIRLCTFFILVCNSVSDP
jgi:hypothetical protein